MGINGSKDKEKLSPISKNKTPLASRINTLVAGVVLSSLVSLNANAEPGKIDSEARAPDNASTVYFGKEGNAKLYKQNGEWVMAEVQAGSLDNNFDTFTGTAVIGGKIFSINGNGMTFDVNENTDALASNIGLDYKEIAQGNLLLAQAIADGEKEFYKNLGNIDVQEVMISEGFKDLDEEEIAEIWQEIAETLGEADLQQRMLNILDVSNENMLIKFYNLFKDDEKFDKLRYAGITEIREKLQEKSRQLEKRHNQINGILGHFKD